MNSYRSVDDLRREAAITWPISFAHKDTGAALVAELLATQDDFISILNFPVSAVEDFLAILPSSRIRPNLFLKHLIVLSDFSAELIKRTVSNIERFMPNGVLEYEWNGEIRSYRFSALRRASAGSIKKKLGIEGELLFEVYPLDDVIREMIVLLVIGGNSVDEDAAEWFAKCEIGNYLGDKAKLEKFVKQRYIWVSTVAKGATANSLGHAAQQLVKDFLATNIDLPDLVVQSDGRLPGVSHYDPESGEETNFDIVVSTNSKYVGIEVSFQVTTNSVIQRKSREAKSSHGQVRAEGHRLAYVIDGAGNFERRRAVEIICENSDCTVALTEPELQRLASFVGAFLRE